MRLSVPWGNYEIYGTNKPGSIGHAISNECIRMFNHHINQLYSWVEMVLRLLDIENQLRLIAF